MSHVSGRVKTVTAVSRPRLRGAALGAVLVLYGVSIPWYRESDAPLRLLFGLPDWAMVAFLCYVLAAFANAVGWYATSLADPDPEPDPANPELGAAATRDRDPP